jgi:hypothetical protein
MPNARMMGHAVGAGRVTVTGAALNGSVRELEESM